MSLHELIHIPDGCHLVVEGLGEKTRRDLRYPRGWKGLAADERALVERWVSRLGTALFELHTDVPVGAVPSIGGGAETELERRQAEDLYPLRIDCCALVDDRWLLCEVKQDAGYIALGQVLMYHFFACRTCECLARCVPTIVTDEVQRGLLPAFEHYGVSVVEVGFWE